MLLILVPCTEQKLQQKGFPTSILQRVRLRLSADFLVPHVNIIIAISPTCSSTESVSVSLSGNLPNIATLMSPALHVSVSINGTSDLATHGYMRLNIKKLDSYPYSLQQKTRFSLGVNIHRY
jgi:hypothetical protein